MYALHIFQPMTTYMDSLLLQNDYAWAPKFLDSLEKQPHLKWLTDKIKKSKEGETTARAPSGSAIGTCELSVFINTVTRFTLYIDMLLNLYIYCRENRQASPLGYSRNN